MEERKKAGSAKDGRGEKDCEETEGVWWRTAQPCRAPPSTWEFPNPLFTCPLQKERKLLSAISVDPDLDNDQLNRSRIFKNMEPHSQIMNKKEVISKTM